MRIAFRADASLQLGTGDLVSCLALERRARRRGHQSLVLARDHTPARDLLARSGAAHELLPAAQPLEVELEWIGAVCRRFGTDAIVFEITERGLDAYEPMPPPAPVMAAIDFFGAMTPRYHLVVNWDAGGAARYRTEDFPETTFLLGPQFVVLAPEFDAAAARERRIRARGRDVLIAMGGADGANHTVAVLEILEEVGGQLEVCVVVGSANPHRRSIERAAAGSRHHVEVVGPLAHLFDRMSACDLAFAAGGLTAMELLASGTPAVLIAAVPHQVSRCRHFADQGAAVYWGEEIGDVAARRAEVDDLLQNSERRRSMSLVARRVLGGGKGGERILDALETLVGGRSGVEQFR